MILRPEMVSAEGRHRTYRAWLVDQGEWRVSLGVGCTEKIHVSPRDVASRGLNAREIGDRDPPGSKASVTYELSEAIAE